MHPALRHYYYYSSSSEALPEDSTVARNVANFITSSSSAATASARVTGLEVNTGSGDVAKSWAFWIKGDNLNKLHDKILSVSNATNEQYMAFWVNAQSTTADLPLKLRWDIIGNSAGTVFLEAQTSMKLLRNRWYHVVVTYSGSGAATGINFYINGTLDSSALKTTTGAYSSAYQDANMRLVLGGSLKGSSGSYYGGQMCEFSIWNRVLTAGEVTTLYNGGEPITASASGFYSGVCIESFPLSSNATGAEGTALTASNVTFVSSKVNTAIESISFKKHSDTNTRYVAFGGLLPLTGTNYAWYGRDGSAHITQGNVHKSLIDRADFIANPTNAVVVSEATTEHVSGVSAGNINDSVALFYAKYSDTSGLFVDEGRRVSSDGLTGTTFGSYTGSMGNTYPRHEFYGKVVAGFSSGEYFVPFFEHNNDVEWRISVFKTTDNGSNWSKIQVVDSLEKLGEPALLNVGNDTLLIICRNNSNKLWQIGSTDGGTTWGTPAATNLGTGICNADMCLDENGKITLVFMDRADDFIWISQSNTIATILADPLAWNAASKLFRSYTTDSLNVLGYPNILYVGSRKYVMSVSAEFSSSRADLFWGYGTLTSLGG